MTKYLDNEGLTHFTGKMKGYADGKAGEVDGKVTSHVNDKKNPHGVTKEQIGLSKVIDETQLPVNQKGKPNGVATLDANGKVPVIQMPQIKTINGEPIFGSGNLQLSASLYKIVDQLPTTGIDTSKIYLVPASATTAKNNKTEYIYLGDPNKAYDESKWEKLGDEQKNTTITTPGGSIKVDTAFDTTSSNPIANKTVTDKFGLVDKALDGKVAQGDYTTKMAAIDSTLEELKKKETITVDAELKDSTNPIQNKAVNAAVIDLKSKVASKANSADLNAATGRITTLETNVATTVIEEGEGNGISGISKSGNTITATKGNFLTSAAGLATKEDITLDKLVEKGIATETWVNERGFATGTIPTSTSQLTNDSGFLTDTSLNEYVNKVQPDKTSGNGIASITKEGKVLKVTKSTFLTDHQSLAGYVNDVNVTEVTNGNGIASITKTKEGKILKVTQGAFLTGMPNGTIYEEGTGNGIVDIFLRGTVLCKRKGSIITNEILKTSIKDYASEQGYLTKNDMKETVVIKLVSDKSESDTNLNGVTVTVKSGDTTVSTQTWQGIPIKVEVPCGEEVMIEAQKKEGYKVSTIESFTPIPLNKRNIIITYKSLPLGVFIIDTNDNLIDRNSWDESTQPAVGVALITEKVAIVIPTGTKYGLKWSTKSQLVEGIVTTTNKTEAGKDYKGKANTEAIVSALGTEAEAAYYCSNFTFKNGKKGYLMSAGEAEEIFYNISTITTLLNVIDSGQNNINSDLSVWTSTQNSTSSAWTRKEMGLESMTKIYNNKTVVPIYSLYD